MGLPSPHNPSRAIQFLVSRILFVGGPFNVFDDLLARVLSVPVACLTFHSRVVMLCPKHTLRKLYYFDT